MLSFSCRFAKGVQGADPVVAHSRGWSMRFEDPGVLRPAACLDRQYPVLPPSSRTAHHTQHTTNCVAQRCSSFFHAITSVAFQPSEGLEACSSAVAPPPPGLDPTQCADCSSIGRTARKLCSSAKLCQDGQHESCVPLACPAVSGWTCPRCSAECGEWRRKCATPSCRTRRPTWPSSRRPTSLLLRHDSAVENMVRSPRSPSPSCRPLAAACPTRPRAGSRRSRTACGNCATSPKTTTSATCSRASCRKLGPRSPTRSRSTNAFETFGPEFKPSKIASSATKLQSNEHSGPSTRPTTSSPSRRSP